MSRTEASLLARVTCRRIIVASARLGWSRRQTRAGSWNSSGGHRERATELRRANVASPSHVCGAPRVARSGPELAPQRAHCDGGDPQATRLPTPAYGLRLPGLHGSRSIRRAKLSAEAGEPLAVGAPSFQGLSGPSQTRRRIGLRSLRRSSRGRLPPAPDLMRPYSSPFPCSARSAWQHRGRCRRAD